MPKSVSIAKRNVSVPAAVSAKSTVKRNTSMVTNSAKRIPIGGTIPVTLGTKTTSIKKKTLYSGSSSMEWYLLTEMSMHLLNAAIIKMDKEQIAESNKISPDQDKIRELESKIHKIVMITRDTKNFESKARMEELIQEYGK